MTDAVFFFARVDGVSDTGPELITEEHKIERERANESQTTINIRWQSDSCRRRINLSLGRVCILHCCLKGANSNEMHGVFKEEEEEEESTVLWNNHRTCT